MQEKLTVICPTLTVTSTHTTLILRERCGTGAERLWKPEDQNVCCEKESSIYSREVESKKSQYGCLNKIWIKTTPTVAVWLWVFYKASLLDGDLQAINGC